MSVVMCVLALFMSEAALVGSFRTHTNQIGGKEETSAGSKGQIEDNKASDVSVDEDEKVFNFDVESAKRMLSDKYADDREESATVSSGLCAQCINHFLSRNHNDSHGEFLKTNIYGLAFESCKGRCNQCTDKCNDFQALLSGKHETKMSLRVRKATFDHCYKSCPDDPEQAKRAPATKASSAGTADETTSDGPVDADIQDAIKIISDKYGNDHTENTTVSAGRCGVCISEYLGKNLKDSLGDFIQSSIYGFAFEHCRDSCEQCTEKCDVYQVGLAGKYESAMTLQVRKSTFDKCYKPCADKRVPVIVDPCQACKDAYAKLWLDPALEQRIKDDHTRQPCSKQCSK